LMVAISSWFSGVLAEIYGVRRVMFIGLILFYLGSFFFLVFGMPTHNLYWIVPTYAIRGLAYPLFAYGFPVFIPALLIAEHYDKDVWLSVVTWLWMVNVIFNLLWGIIGDKLGWRNVVMWFGCVGCAITTFLFFYAIEAHASVLTITLIASVYGCFLAAFVPLSAIMPMLAPKEKGAAMSILNFGAGMSNFITNSCATTCNNSNFTS